MSCNHECNQGRDCDCANQLCDDDLTLDGWWLVLAALICIGVGFFMGARYV